MLARSFKEVQPSSKIENFRIDWRFMKRGYLWLMMLEKTVSLLRLTMGKLK